MQKTFPKVANASGTLQVAGEREQAGTRSLPVWVILLAGVVIGLLIAILWRADIADEDIGFTVAGTILPGSTAHGWAVANAWIGLVFAIAAGLGTTFTACNCVVFSCIAPLSNQKDRTHMGIGRLLLWMALGVVCVTLLYGIVGAVLSKQLPSLSTAVLPALTGSSRGGIPVRLLQSSTVFVSLGVLFLYWGLVTLQLAINPFKRFIQRHPEIVPLSLGVVVGFFTVGRPYPLFHTLLQYSAGTENPLLSGLLVALQGLCNIALMALLFWLLTWGTRGRFERWMFANPFRAKALTALSVIGGGTFLIAYWGVRLYANYGIGWFPHL
ncbi:MAG TPA: hypothetical protein VFV38_33390 [Ktedonobacteraceae bacterium]|nr:hypothetical protein [Ktedonobacteraceae bacterium]